MRVCNCDLLQPDLTSALLVDWIWRPFRARRWGCRFQGLKPLAESWSPFGAKAMRDASPTDPTTRKYWDRALNTYQCLESVPPKSRPVGYGLFGAGVRADSMIEVTKFPIRRPKTWTLSVGLAAPDHTVPYGTVLWRDAFPGTSCLATIMLSLRDKGHFDCRGLTLGNPTVGRRTSSSSFVLVRLSGWQ